MWLIGVGSLGIEVALPGLQGRRSLDWKRLAHDEVAA
jgi:hypothetical protein